MSPSISSSSSFPSVVRARRRALVKAARRLVSAVARGKIGGHPWVDDRANVRDLLLCPASSLAECPLCAYRGPFLTFAGRARELCPRCRGKARHRALAVALDQRLAAGSSAERPAWRRGLHLAPEACLRPFLDPLCEQWMLADLEPLGAVATLGLDPSGRRRLDAGADLVRLPFADTTFDLLIASHVLKHVVDDRAALTEIFRVLRPGGTAILLVPIVVETTVEFGEARPEHNDHARDCGLDYFDRYREAGFAVEIVASDRLPGAHERALVTGTSGAHPFAFCRVPEPAANGDAS